MKTIAKVKKVMLVSEKTREFTGKVVVRLVLDKKFKSLVLKHEEVTIDNGASLCTEFRILGFYNRFSVEEVDTNVLTISLPRNTARAIKEGDEIAFEQTLISEGEIYNGDTIAEHPIVITNLTISAEIEKRAEEIRNREFEKLFNI